MKRLILFFTTVLLFVFAIGPTPTGAFSAVLGARVIGDEGVSIDGYQADDPESPITLDDFTPTFSGYTIPNAELTLIIRSEPQGSILPFQTPPATGVIPFRNRCQSANTPYR